MDPTNATATDADNPTIHSPENPTGNVTDHVAGNVTDDPQALPPPDRSLRPAWEVAALFAGITLLLFLWWQLQHPAGTSRQAALGTTMNAEHLAQMALAASPQGRPSGPTWREAREQYREALKAYPTLPRARRGLAAMEYVDGNPGAAKSLMKGPADVPGGDRRVWRAFQAAFRAAPADPKAHVGIRETLKRKDLGWSRFVALKALATDPKEAARWDRAMRGRPDLGKNTGALMVFLGGAGALIFLLGLTLLAQAFSHPPESRLKAMAAPAGSLIVLSVIALITAQLPAAILQMGWLAAGVKTPSARQMIWMTSGGTVAGAILALACSHVLLQSVGSRLSEIGWRTRGALRWGLGGYVAVTPLMLLALALSQALLRLFPNVPTPDNPAAGMATAAQGFEVLAVLLFASVFVPIAEELVMRGLLFRGLAQRYGTIVGALASSFVFAGLHPQLPAGFPPLFVIGLALCFVYRATGSLVPAIILHGVSNAIVLVMARLAIG